MTHKPSRQITWELSPIYNAKMYRNQEVITKESAMEGFLDWLKNDAEMSNKQAKNVIKFLEPLISKYLGVDKEKVKAGEKELLSEWIKACKPS